MYKPSVVLPRKRIRPLFRHLSCGNPDRVYDDFELVAMAQNGHNVGVHLRIARSCFLKSVMQTRIIHIQKHFAGFLEGNDTFITGVGFFDYNWCHDKDFLRSLRENEPPTKSSKRVLMYTYLLRERPICGISHTRVEAPMMSRRVCVRNDFCRGNS